LAINSRNKHLLQTISFVVVLSAGVLVPACAHDPQVAKRRHLDAGKAYLASGQTREAVIELRNAIQIDPRFAEARVELAGAHEKLGDGSSALAEYVRAADLLPQDASVQLIAGNYLLAARRPADALARAEGVLAREPDNVEAHILRGNALGGLERFDNALQEMEEALRLDPTRGVIHTQIGLVETARGEYQAAEKAFTRAIELSPKEVGGHLALANFYWVTGRLEDAERSLERALAVEPNNRETNRALAVFALASGRVGDAEKYLIRLADLSKDPAAVFALAEYYMATRRADQAISLLEPFSDDAKGGYSLARAYSAAGAGEKAHALVDRILKGAPQNAEALLLKGQLLIQDGKAEEGLQNVRSALQADPDSIGAHFTLGKAYAARGDFQGAESAFREVLKRNPAAMAASIELAQLQLALGSQKASLRSAENAIAQQPRSLQANLAVVRSLLANKEFERAQQQLEPLLAEFPSLAAVQIQAGVLAASRNNAAEARTRFERALQLEPNSVEAFGGLIALDLNRRDFATARGRIDRRLQEPHVSSDMILLAARTYGSIGDLDAAERTLRRSVDSDPTLLPAYSMLAQIYMTRGKLEEARLEFDKLAARTSNPASALTMSGLILQAQGNDTLARERYERAVAADGRAVVAANNLAWLYAESGEKLAEALRLARSAAEVLTDSPEVLDTLGWVYYKNALPGLAVAPLTRAIERSPGNATYRYHLGMVYAKTGDGGKARAELTRAIELNRAAKWVPEARRALNGVASSTSSIQ
jgi:Tfp pilus assembly protein PilF